MTHTLHRRLEVKIKGEDFILLDQISEQIQRRISDVPGLSKLEDNYEKGKPEGEDMGKWRQKLTSRQERLKYLESGERYWYGEEWYGSERRKNPA